MGLVAFAREVSTAYSQAEQELRQQANFVGNQTAQLIEYLYQQAEPKDVPLWLSQLSTAPHLNMALLLDDQNRVIESTRLALQLQALSNTELAAEIAQVQQVRHTKSGRVFVSRDQQKIYAIYPVGLDRNVGKMLPSRIGILLIEYNLAELKQKVYFSAVQRSSIYILCLIGSSLLLWYFLSRVVMLPLQRLTSASSQVRSGNLEVRVKICSSRELASLAESFNQMVLQLRESFLALAETNAELEQRVCERTAALAIANQELQRLAHVDGLTQLANRRCFDQVLEQAWHSRHQQSLSLVLCDVDFFKRYNDLYGHQAGDDCLKQVADVLRQMVHRPSDLVARYGGEEFALILIDTPIEAALIISEQLCEAVQALRLPHQGSEISDCITVSVGVACLTPVDHLTIEQLIMAADRALYQAKQCGRNRVIAHA